ncbi:tyrosine-protein phosphatase [Marinobacterium jannaschii]|uniref:tyrosine-protein phosphatase n=1 Tax=Marinobacterium jannaschii TaxID=64970 RepID=UPI0004866FBE|nr:CpsB/CapC family capsule biosynthesis tyrosine phosphatase [Marinobacterium jannaschii]
MFDLHSHILPGIDDGAETMEQSLHLVQIAVDDGIRHITVTPHIHPGRFENSVKTIKPVFEAFAAEIVRAGLPLSLAMGAEVRLSPEILAMTASDSLPFIGSWQGKRVLLLELPHSHIPPGSDKLVAWLKARNILPMIAHPERNKDIIRDLDKINPFVEAGCLFQLTAMSVAGGFGEEARLRSEQLLERGWATVIASDAHNERHRPPRLSAGVEAAAEIVGEQQALRLVQENPARLVHD